jgi:hypothetical protein
VNVKQHPETYENLVLNKTQNGNKKKFFKLLVRQMRLDIRGNKYCCVTKLLEDFVTLVRGRYFYSWVTPKYNN